MSFITGGGTAGGTTSNDRALPYLSYIRRQRIPKNVTARGLMSSMLHDHVATAPFISAVCGDRTHPSSDVDDLRWSIPVGSAVAGWILLWRRFIVSRFPSFFVQVVGVRRIGASFCGRNGCANCCFGVGLSFRRPNCVKLAELSSLKKRGVKLLPGSWDIPGVLMHLSVADVRKCTAVVVRFVFPL